MAKIKFYLELAGKGSVFSGVEIADNLDYVRTHKNAYSLARGVCIALLLGKVRQLRLQEKYSSNRTALDSIDFGRVEITLPSASESKGWRKVVIDALTSRGYRPFKAWPEKLTDKGEIGRLLVAGKSENSNVMVIKLTSAWKQHEIEFFANKDKTPSMEGHLCDSAKLLKYAKQLLQGSAFSDHSHDPEHFLSSQCPIDSPTEERAQTLEQWLKQLAESNQFSRIKRSGQHVKVDDCILLDSAREAGGYEAFDLSSEGCLTIFPQIHPSDFESWMELRWKAYRKSNGRSAMTTAFCPENARSRARLYYCMIGHECGPAFTQLLDTPGVIDRYQSNILNVLTYAPANRTTLQPHILSTGTIVILGKDEPKIVIANRSNRGDFAGNRWSVSIATHFKPEKEIVSGNRVSIPDISIHASVERGLKEELLGANFDFRDNHSRIGIYAFAMNGKLFYFFIAVAHFPELSFDQLVELQKSSETRERKENTALGFIDAKSTFFKAALSTDMLSGENPIQKLKARGLVNVETSHQIPGTAWNWQRGSGLRLAIAEWYLKTQLKS